MDKDQQISLLKQQLEKERDKNFQLQQVLDSIPASVYWKDKYGVCLGRNFFAAEIMYQLKLEPTLDKDAVVGKTDYDFFDKNTADKYRIKLTMPKNSCVKIWKTRSGWVYLEFTFFTCKVVINITTF